MPFVTVARLGELQPGDIKAVRVADQDVIVYNSNGTHYAAQRRCLHQGADLSEGLVSRGFLVCAQHGWRFHASSGVHEISTETCLQTYDVRVVEGNIQVNSSPRLCSLQGEP